MRPVHTERHLIDRIGWLRADMLGANDGLVSTTRPIVGVAASSAAGEILVAGSAGRGAGAMSMAAGEYVSVSSQADTERADLALAVEALATTVLPRRSDLQPLATPDALNPVLAHLPPGCLQQRGDAAVAIAPVIGRQSNDGPGQPFLVGRHGGPVALRAAVLTDDPAGVTFRETVLLPDAVHRLPVTLGGYKFPEATSAST